MNTDNLSRNHYLRVGREWTKLYDPQPKGVYIVNTSGHPVRCLLSSTRPVQPYNDEDAVPVGGSIAQLRVNADQYVYARAIVDNDTDEAVLACNTTGTPLDADDVNDIKYQLSSIISQIMRMNMNTTRHQLDQIKQITDFRVFMQDYYEDTLQNNSREAARGKLIMTVLNRIFSVEIWLSRHKLEFARLAEEVKYFDSKSELSQRVKAMSEDLSTALAATRSITARLDVLEPMIEEGWQDQSDLIATQITPIKTELQGFHQDVRYLNNALVRFMAAHTVPEVNAIFEELIRDANDDTRDATIAFRDLIVELMQATATNTAQDLEMQEKVDYDDNIHVGTDLGTIAAIMNGTAPEPEPPAPEPDTAAPSPEHAEALAVYEVRKKKRKKK